MTDGTYVKLWLNDELYTILKCSFERFLMKLFCKLTTPLQLLFLLSLTLETWPECSLDSKQMFANFHFWPLLRRANGAAAYGPYGMGRPHWGQNA